MIRQQQHHLDELIDRLSLSPDDLEAIAKKARSILKQGGYEYPELQGGAVGAVLAALARYREVWRLFECSELALLYTPGEWYSYRNEHAHKMTVYLDGVEQRFAIAVNLADQRIQRAIQRDDGSLVAYHEPQPHGEAFIDQTTWCEIIYGKVEVALKG